MTPKFAGDNGFYSELKRRVADTFLQSGRAPKDNLRMYVKTAILLCWFVGSYALLVFAATTWWQGLLCSFALATAMAGIGFSIQHDANHGAYSKHRAVNRAMGLTLDLLGGSSYLWRFKHNVSHHTYTNLEGADDDIDIGGLGRLSPEQPHRNMHRLQQFYLWVFYGFLVAEWHLWNDFNRLLRARVARTRFARPRGWDLFEFCAGKAVFVGWAFVIPMFFHPWWVVLLFYATTVFVVGFILSVVFQLAHCVEEARFPVGSRLPDTWAVHQIQTTVNFAPHNRLLTWYVGGLNFQIEHHLFPRICHVHYRRIAPVVQAVCAEFGVRYTAHPSLGSAVVSHWRWLRRMG